MKKIEHAYYSERWDRNKNEFAHLEEDVEIILWKLNEVIDVVNELATQTKSKEDTND